MEKERRSIRKLREEDFRSYFLHPITLGISYGIFSAAANSRVFSGPQTAGIGILGIVSSALIAWYDHVQWKKDMISSNINKGLEQKPFYLSRRIQMQMENLESSHIGSHTSGNSDIFSFRVTLPINR
jgi:hypothetical protein